MGRYRKKPVVIEAFQWTGHYDENNSPPWFNEALKADDVELWSRIDGKCDLVVKTLEGSMAANHGDYIIKGVQGEIYPCKPDIFEQTYEVAE